MPVFFHTDLENTPKINRDNQETVSIFLFLQTPLGRFMRLAKRLNE